MIFTIVVVAMMVGAALFHAFSSQGFLDPSNAVCVFNNQNVFLLFTVTVEVK